MFISTWVQGAETKTAHETVGVATEVLLQRLKDMVPIYAEDPERFFDEIDDALEPYIDFERFARGVMAKYYKTSTEEERTEFIRVFRHDLIRTYGKSLISFDNEKIIVLPEENAAQAEPDKRDVKLEIHAKNGQIYPVEYAMILDGGDWKLRNVVVNGVNMGLTFRNHFSSLAQKNKGNISAVIAAWSSEVELGE